MTVKADRRGTWGNWLVQQRKQHGNQTQQAVRETLAKMGHPISEAYYGDFERGKSTPSADWQAVFERLWGSLPTTHDYEPEREPALSSDDAAIKAALQLQTELLGKLWISMEKQSIAITAVSVAIQSLVGRLAEGRDDQVGMNESLLKILARLEDAVAPESKRADSVPEIDVASRRTQLP